MTPLSYKEFRTGYTYKDVYYFIYNRKWKRRRGVLGYWKQLKQEMYEQYLNEFDSNNEYIVSNEPIPD